MKNENIIEIAKRIWNSDWAKERRIERANGKMLVLFMIIFILIMLALIYSMFGE